MEIAAAFREKRDALRGDADSLAQLAEAYRVLSSAELRAEYDARFVSRRPARRQDDEAVPGRGWMKIAIPVAFLAIVLIGWSLRRGSDVPRVVSTAQVITTNSATLSAAPGKDAATSPSGSTSSSAAPRSAQDVFQRTQRSIVRVLAGSFAGEASSQGSGVVVGRGDVITNCHVVEGAHSVEVKTGEDTYPATVSVADREFDLCRLSVSGLDAPAVTVAGAADLQTGERVFAIGAPRGLELTISDGIVSSLREVPAGRIIQTTAAVSPGSSGGGLFDAQARLVGIVTFQRRDGQNLNFAVPADWIAQMRNR